MSEVEKSGFYKAKMTPPRLDARFMMFPLSADSLRKIPEPRIEQLISRTDYRVETELRDVHRSTFQINGIDLIVYQQGKLFPLSSDYTVQLPSRLNRAMDYISRLSPEDTLVMCYSRSEDLVRLGLADTQFYILPMTEDNIIGNTGVHSIAGYLLDDGRYAFIDPTWPPDEEDCSSGIPHGIVIVGSNKKKADKIATLIYGGVPQTQ